MSTAGLFYVGAVLIINGLLLLGVVSPRGAAPLNYFVGGLQVVTPLVLLARAETVEEVVAAAPLFLFGFTYLWVALNNTFDWSGEGLGWFSAFVALAALGFAGHAAIVGHDGPFTVIWICWAILWALFWVVLGLGRDDYAGLTGGVAIVQGIVTAAIPAFLMLVDGWSTGTGMTIAIAIAAAAGMLFVLVLRSPAKARARAAAEAVRDAGADGPQPTATASAG